MAVLRPQSSTEGRRFRTGGGHQSGMHYGAALSAALLLAALALYGARTQAWRGSGLRLQLRQQLASSFGSLAAWAGLEAGGEAGGDLDAAIEARIPRYWQELERICPNMTYKPCQEYDAAQRTSLAHSQLDPLPSFRGLGRWHTLRLRTATGAGELKARGGDTLWAVLHDNTTQRRLPVRPFDEGDGSYTLAFVALAPGNYTLILRLFYSLCAGFQDPFFEYERILENARDTAHCYDGEKRVFDSPLVVIPEAPQFSPIPDASGGSGNDPLLGRTAARNSSDPRTGGGDGGASSGDSSSIASESGASGAAGDTSTAGAAVEVPGASLSVQLVAPVLRADHYVYRNGPLATPNASLGLQLHPLGMLRQPWRLAVGPERQRLIMWGDSTVKRVIANLVALARYPCVWPDKGWAHRLHLELWHAPECQEVPSGQSDPSLEEALKGCTAGAELATVPVGCGHHLQEHEMPFQDQVPFFNMTNWQYNDTFAKRHGTWPVPKQFSIVYNDGWGLRIIDVLRRDIQNWHGNDTVIYNIGAHSVRLMAFADWKRYLNELAVELAKCNATVVWRSTMPFAEHSFRRKDGSSFFSHGHFQNEARRVLFDSYAEYTLRAAGIRFWDISAFALAGAHGPHDAFHFDGHTMRDLNLDMAQQITC